MDFGDVSYWLVYGGDLPNQHRFHYNISEHRIVQVLCELYRIHCNSNSRITSAWEWHS